MSNSSPTSRVLENFYSQDLILISLFRPHPNKLLKFHQLLVPIAGRIPLLYGGEMVPVIPYVINVVYTKKPEVLRGLSQTTAKPSSTKPPPALIAETTQAQHPLVQELAQVMADVMVQADLQLALVVQPLIISTPPMTKKILVRLIHTQHQNNL